MGNVVALVHVQNSENGTKNAISEALRLIKFKFNGIVNSVVIKPNLCYYWDANTGYTTDPEVVASIIDYVREIYGKDISIKIVEADASAMRTKYAFPILGYEKLAKEKEVELFNLSEDTLINRTVKVNGRKISFKIPKILLNSNLFINVPKLKIMRATKITCAMKNIFGCIGAPRKIVYHKFLDEAIVGINKVLRPHLTLVDGVIALGRCPTKLGLIMAGVDPFSVDWIASKIMGYNPLRIKFLRIALKEKVGSIHGIVTCGKEAEEFAKLFPREALISTSLLWNIQLKLLRAYQKIVDDIIPPILE
jgi:uncharacterized protein (DUF362 family)